MEAKANAKQSGEFTPKQQQILNGFLINYYKNRKKKKTVYTLVSKNNGATVSVLSVTVAKI